VKELVKEQELKKKLTTKMMGLFTVPLFF